MGVFSVLFPPRPGRDRNRECEMVNRAAFGRRNLALALTSGQQPRLAVQETVQSPFQLCSLATQDKLVPFQRRFRGAGPEMNMVEAKILGIFDDFDACAPGIFD